jgi:hypothetical protein
MKLTITKSFLAVLLAQGCSLGEVEEIEVEMYGVVETVEGAAGDRDPSYQTWWLKEVHIVPSEGDPLDFVYDNEGIPFRIVGRPQIIFQHDMSDFMGVEFSRLELVFGDEVLGGDQNIKDKSFTLSQPTLTLTGPFEMKKARKLKALLELSWAKSLSEESLLAPGIEFKFK